MQSERAAPTHPVNDLDRTLGRTLLGTTWRLRPRLLHRHGRAIQRDADADRLFGNLEFRDQRVLDVDPAFAHGGADDMTDVLEARSRVWQRSLNRRCCFGFARRAAREPVSHRTRGVRQPLVGDRAGSQGNRVDRVLITTAAWPIQRALNLNFSDARLVRGFMATDPVVQESIDSEPRLINVEGCERRAVRLTFDRVSGLGQRNLVRGSRPTGGASPLQ